MKVDELDRNGWKWMNMDENGWKWMEMDTMDGNGNHGWKWIKMDEIRTEKVKMIQSEKGSGHSRPGSYYVKGWPQMTASYNKLRQMAQDLPTW